MLRLVHLLDRPHLKELVARWHLMGQELLTQGQEQHFGLVSPHR